MALLYHGTPMTPREALNTVLPQRASCVSYFRPDDASAVESICPFIMYDCGSFSFWKHARRAGREWEEAERDWRPYYGWVDQRLWVPGRWAVIPDRIGAPSQLNDALLSEWPHGKSRGAPVWHMNEPIERLARLADSGYSRICFGWVGRFDSDINDIAPQERAVGCDAYRRRMDEVDALFCGNWPIVHQFRGAAVSADYRGKIETTDCATLARDGYRHDWRDRQSSLFVEWPSEPWIGRRLYADHLEAMAA